MFEGIINVNGTNWRVRAKNKGAALDEIAHASVTGSIGSTSEVDNTLCGGTIELIASVHKLDENGNDVKPYGAT